MRSLFGGAHGSLAWQDFLAMPLLLLTRLPILVRLLMVESCKLHAWVTFCTPCLSAWCMPWRASREEGV
jgi:hypothetical protein